MISQRKTEQFILVYWKIIIVWILICSLIFYGVLFSKFTVLRRDLEKWLGDLEVSSEFKMLYIIKDQTLSISGTDFYLQNVMLVVAMFSITVLGYKAQLKKEQE